MLPPDRLLAQAITNNNKEPSTPFKADITGEALTPNPEIVNDKGSPPGKSLGNRIIAANYINTTVKLIRDSLSIKTTSLVDTN